MTSGALRRYDVGNLPTLDHPTRLALDLDHLRTWIGSSESRVERLSAFPANALAATLDRADPPYADGSPLPPLWHWLHFLPLAALADSAPDGHAARGELLPPVPLPRRMWAGSRLTFHAPPAIGATLRRTSTVRGVEHKRGRTGDLVFVTVLHEVFDGERRLIDEEHDIVYRAAARPDDAAPTPPGAPSSGAFSRDVRPDPVLLFRYSALTFNSHRIHYDRPYVTREEGYPGLVVHGPLIATLLLDLLRRELPAASVATFRFRNVAPLFDTEAFSVHGEPRADGEVRLWARRADGGIAMEASATLRPARD